MALVEEGEGSRGEVGKGDEVSDGVGRIKMETSNGEITAVMGDVNGDGSGEDMGVVRGMGKG